MKFGKRCSTCNTKVDKGYIKYSVWMDKNYWDDRYQYCDVKDWWWETINIGACYSNAKYY